MGAGINRRMISWTESCDQESLERIGRWGEEYVYKFLTAASQLPSGQRILSVTWINETSETGEPYDIEVQIEPQAVLYIEVKSTISAEKEFMQFSWNELQFADKEKQNYHLYRVYSAGSELVTMKWMENLASILTTRPVRLLLELWFNATVSFATFYISIIYFTIIVLELWSKSWPQYNT